MIGKAICSGALLMAGGTLLLPTLVHRWWARRARPAFSAGRTWATAVCLTLFMSAAAMAEEIVRSGYVIEPWVSNLDDIRGVTVGRGGSFGTSPYVYSLTQRAILRVTGAGSWETFATGFGDGTGRIAFDPSGAFGGDMFVHGPLDGGIGNDPIYRVTPSGDVSVFAQPFTAMAKGLSFGNGSALLP